MPHPPVHWLTQVNTLLARVYTRLKMVDGLLWGTVTEIESHILCRKLASLQPVSKHPF